MQKARTECWYKKMKSNNKIRKQENFITWLNERKMLICNIHRKWFTSSIVMLMCKVFEMSKNMRSNIYKQNKVDTSIIMILWFAYLFVDVECVKWNITMTLRFFSIQTFKELNICVFYNNSFDVFTNFTFFILKKQPSKNVF